MAQDAAAFTAHDRFRDHSAARFATGLLAAAVIHFAAFELAPAFQAAVLPSVGGRIELMELPPQVEVPPPPQRVARPATPTVATTEVDEEMTISRTTFEANPVETLPPPPRTGAASSSERPTFIPRDVEPRLVNRAEFQRLLAKAYPAALRSAGIGGTVVVWIFVSKEGEVARCQVKESSGYKALDRAAERVAQKMRFKPALAQDRPIGVWVAQRITFSVDA